MSMVRNAGVLVSMMLCVAVCVFAIPGVAQAQIYAEIVQDGKETSVSGQGGLFEGFEDLVAGQEVSDDIVVVNRTDDIQRVFVHMQPLDSIPNPQVMVGVGTESQIVWMPLSEMDEGWLELGCLDPGTRGHYSIYVTSESTVGNDFQLTEHAVQVQLACQQVSDAARYPTTHDATSVLAIGLMAVCGIAGISLWAFRARDRWL